MGAQETGGARQLSDSCGEARAPQPIAADVTAAELIVRLTEIEPDEGWHVAQPWLAERTELQAARDLLAAAADATPAARIAAIELVDMLGPEAERAWSPRRGLDRRPGSTPFDLDEIRRRLAADPSPSFAATTSATES